LSSRQWSNPFRRESPFSAAPRRSSTRSYTSIPKESRVDQEREEENNNNGENTPEDFTRDYSENSRERPLSQISWCECEEKNISVLSTGSGEFYPTFSVDSTPSPESLSNATSENFNERSHFNGEPINF